MKKPTAPPHHSPGHPLMNDDQQRVHWESQKRLHAECRNSSPEEIRVHLLKGTWTGWQATIAEEWLIYYRYKSERWNRFWMITGGVSAIAAAIFGAIAIF